MADPLKMLKALETALEKAKIDKANLEGQKSSIMKDLEEVFGISTVEEGEDLIKDYDESIEELETQMGAMIEKANKLMELS